MFSIVKKSDLPGPPGGSFYNDIGDRLQKIFFPTMDTLLLVNSKTKQLRPEIEVWGHTSP